MNAATASSLIMQAHKQRTLTGKPDAIVTFFIRGKWADKGKHLDGRKGPLGRCLAEFEKDILCEFKADEVITYCGQFLPIVDMTKFGEPADKLG